MRLVTGWLVAALGVAACSKGDRGGASGALNPRPVGAAPPSASAAPVASAPAPAAPAPAAPASAGGSRCARPDALRAFVASAWKVAPDAVTVDGCVAGRFPAAGIAVAASVETPDGESQHRLAVIGDDGAIIARQDGAADKARFASIDALSALQAADLDGDGTDEIIATETSAYKLSPTTEAVVVLAIKTGAFTPLLHRGYAHVTADDADGDEGTVLCDGTVTVAGTPPVVTITGKLAASAAAIKAARAQCVDGAETYVMNAGALIKR